MVIHNGVLTLAEFVFEKFFSVILTVVSLAVFIRVFPLLRNIVNGRQREKTGKNHLKNSNSLSNREKPSCACLLFALFVATK